MVKQERIFWYFVPGTLGLGRNEKCLQLFLGVRHWHVGLEKIPSDCAKKKSTTVQHSTRHTLASLLFYTGLLLRCFFVWVFKNGPLWNLGNLRRKSRGKFQKRFWLRRVFVWTCHERWEYRHRQVCYSKKPCKRKDGGVFSKQKYCGIRKWVSTNVLPEP